MIDIRRLADHWYKQVKRGLKVCEKWLLKERENSSSAIKAKTRGLTQLAGWQSAAKYAKAGKGGIVDALTGQQQGVDKLCP